MKFSSLLNKFSRFLPDCPPVSYAQNGEDAYLFSILDTDKPGFYVDLGAFHPIRFSNTYGLYLKGWSGIAIDARPGFKASYQEVRERDIVVECGVSEQEEVLNFYEFIEPAMNTFDKNELKKMIDIHKSPPIATHQIPCFPLASIIDKHAPTNTTIDLLSIDVEGMDFTAIRSLNWDTQTPNHIVIEDKAPISKTCESPVYRFLATKGYEMIFKNNRNAIYQLTRECQS